MPSNTPQSLGYAAIWSALRAWPAFANPLEIKPGLQTQIDLQAAGFQPPTNAGASDRASVQLLEGQILALPYQRNSKAVQFEVGYPVVIRSGSFLIDPINKTEAVFLQALMKADTVDGVTYPGTLGLPTDINKWVLSRGNSTQRDTTEKRPQWVFAFNVNLTFVWLRSRFLATTFT